MRWSGAGLLRELRSGKGWSQAQLAQVAAVSQQAIASWEAGEREPSASSLFALCRALGVSCEKFAPAGEVATEPPPRAPKGRPRKSDQGGPAPEPHGPKKGKKK